MDNATVTIRLPERLMPGTHLLSWRVISAHSHPVGGALTFSIGQPSRNPSTGRALIPSLSVAGHPAGTRVAPYDCRAINGEYASEPGLALTPPTLGEGRHRGLTRRLVAVGRGAILVLPVGQRPGQASRQSRNSLQLTPIRGPTGEFRI